jgi:murein DD-endopeptidase MepM/ murein hydrolase activator NlpD
LNQPYFIVVLAHSFHGRLRRIHVPYGAIYAVLLLALLGAFSVFGFLSSYLRMAWKVADYNNLRNEFSVLRERYQVLEKESKQTDQQLASLQLLAEEVSMAYGLKRRLEGPNDIADEGRLVPTLSESLEEYNFLRASSMSLRARRSSDLLRSDMLPSIWPVDGRLMSHFGRRSDPFSGEGAIHRGVDIEGGLGEPVRVTADGIVLHAGYSGGYGKLVVVDHGSGFQTYYAHLSRIRVAQGQGIRRGELVGAVGGTGRATGTHLHYEVRRNGTPVNPYQYLRTSLAQASRRADFSF